MGKGAKHLESKTNIFGSGRTLCIACVFRGVWQRISIYQVVSQRPKNSNCFQWDSAGALFLSVGAMWATKNYIYRYSRYILRFPSCSPTLFLLLRVGFIFDSAKLNKTLATKINCYSCRLRCAFLIIYKTCVLIISHI